MLARANFNPYSSSRFVLENQRAMRALGQLPYPVLHRALVGGAWLETWLRWPLKTLQQTDALKDRFFAIDPDASRFGLTEDVQRRYRDNRMLQDLPDLAVLLLKLNDERFRQRAIRTRGAGRLAEVVRNGPGAIVLGFRLGPYPVTPLALAGLGYDVTMIVGGEPLGEAAQELGEAYAPELASKIRYINSLDRSVLATARSDLDAGRIVCTLLELSPYKYAKTTPVRFLGWETQAAYGIPYLAAMTGRSIVPLVMTRSAGPRYGLKFLEPLPPPAPERTALFDTTQKLWTVLEQQVLRYPEHWIGWTRLQSHLGIDVTQPRTQTPG